MILFLFDYIINFMNSEVSHINDAKETGLITVSEHPVDASTLSKSFLQRIVNG